MMCVAVLLARCILMDVHFQYRFKCQHCDLDFIVMTEGALTQIIDYDSEITKILKCPSCSRECSEAQEVAVVPISLSRMMSLWKDLYESLGEIIADDQKWRRWLKSIEDKNQHPKERA